MDATVFPGIRKQAQEAGVARTRRLHEDIALSRALIHRQKDHGRALLQVAPGNGDAGRLIVYANDSDMATEVHPS